MKKVILLCLLSQMVFGQIQFPLRPSADNRYIVDATDKPIYLCGDTPWQLIVDLKREAVLRYFDLRKKQGFNTVLVDLLSEEVEKKQSQCQCYPFGQRDFADINEAYFDHAEWVFETARQQGFVVLCTVAYWGCCRDDEGWRNELIATPADVLKRYGNYLGKRFARFDNVIWTLGGDASRGREKFEAIQAGIREQHPKAQFTYHTREDELATEYHHDLTFEAVYAYTSDRVYRLTERGYRKPKPLPMIYTEGFYDELVGSNFHNVKWTPSLQSRYIHHQMYAFLLSGGLGGFINGNFILWAFPADWPRHMESPNQPAMSHFYRFVNSFRWWTLQPDFSYDLISEGQGRYGDPDFIPVSVSTAESMLIAYVPNFAGGPARRFTINPNRFRAKKGYWMNPANGQKQEVSIPGDGRFTTPTQGLEGWVLVLENR